MEYIANLLKLNGNFLAFQSLEEVNEERLKTLFSEFGNIEATITFKDKRNLSNKQRSLYRALLNNIYQFTGETTDFLHEWFKEAYYLEKGSRISTSDSSSSSKSDMNDLIDIVLDFIFEWNVPFKKGYELLPKEENFYLYQCCKHRKCSICGKHADIHHEEGLVGMGSDRTNYNHTNSAFIALCRTHHTERHTMTWQEFNEKYLVKPIKLDSDTLVKLRLMTKKQAEEISNGTKRLD